MINTNNTLVERLNEAEQHIKKNKHLRVELLTNIEEHDKDKEDTIAKLEQDIQSLRYEVKRLKQRLETNQISVVKDFKNIETQTITNEETKYNTNPCVIKLLTDIDLKQDKMEPSLKQLIDQIFQQNSKSV